MATANQGPNVVLIRCFLTLIQITKAERIVLVTVSNWQYDNVLKPY